MKNVLKTISIILLCFVLTACNTKKSENEDKINNKTNSSNNTYQLNETISLKSNSGTMNLKFLSVTETSERNEYSENIANRVIIIEYEYENVDINDDVYIDRYNFKVYDKNNKILETYPILLEFPQAISKGRNATSKVAYGLNDNNNYIEIELISYADNKNLGKKVILEW